MGAGKNLNPFLYSINRKEQAMNKNLWRFSFKFAWSVFWRYLLITFGAGFIVGLGVGFELLPQWLLDNAEIFGYLISYPALVVVIYWCSRKYDL